MRSSKNRSRSKGNRNRSVGNIVNRVFDSSGPEGKVRGTPQQIIDKYNQLARDATLSNDRVAAENFQQHAEHYTRLLGEAQREQDARRDAQEAQQNQRRERQQDAQGGSGSGGGDGQSNPNQQGHGGHSGNGGGGSGGGGSNGGQGGNGSGGERSGFDDVIETAPDESGLVETPEEAPKPRRRRSRRQNGASDDQSGSGEAQAPDSPPEAAE